MPLSNLFRGGNRRPPQSEVEEAVQAYLSTNSWAETKRIVEARRHALLTDAAEQFLTAILKYLKDPDVIRLGEVKRVLLARCRTVGIDAAFADNLRREKLLPLLHELKTLTGPTDTPRWVVLGPEALSLIDRTKESDLWASLHSSLASQLARFPLGELAESFEEAIHHCEQALEVFTREAFPQDWAMTEFSLAIAYEDRIRGERADNLEQATYHCQQALEVYTREAFPIEWAGVQTVLGTACNERIRGDRADNLEWAIRYFQQAMEVLTQEAEPREWAAIQQNLGNACAQRIRGDRADNLEWAIHSYQQALKVFTREAHPADWARAQNNLALAYTNRIRGERAQNLEWALSCGQQALQAYTRETIPREWIGALNTLANACINRIEGDRAENLEAAISYLQQALAACTPQTFPIEWANTQNNLAMAYRERLRGERADNLEQSIYHCQQALEVYTREAFPLRWANTQNNLAIAYGKRVHGEKAENLEQAIHGYEQVLQVFTREGFPESWAMTEVNLGIAYDERVHGDKADNHLQALRHFEQALQVYRPEAFPQKCRDIAYGLGALLYDTGRFAEARHALTTGHEAIENLRGEVRREGAKRKLAEENADLYARLVHCCLLEGDEAAAFEYAAAGKGRAFVDLLGAVRLDLSAAGADDPDLAADLSKAHQLRQQIDALLASLTGESGPTASDTSRGGPARESRVPMDVLRVQLRDLQAEEGKHWWIMSYKYPALTATQKVPWLPPGQASLLAEELGATLLEYYQHAGGWCAFVVTDVGLHVVPLPLIDDSLLRRMAEWVARIELPEGRNRLSLKRLSEWYTALVTPLRDHLDKDRPVILAPFGPLHLIPVWAARNPDTGAYATQEYTLTSAPSLTALKVKLDQGRRSGQANEVPPQHLLSVAYPGTPSSPSYLTNVLREAQAITGYFPHFMALYGDVATPDAVLANARGQEVVHFGCHGWFETEQPEQSGLMLAGGWLTVQRIITELRLNGARLATLAACVSARARLQRGEEHVGLAQAMITAGAEAVVASLWAVHDAATRALFEAFYAGLAAGRSPASALREGARLVREQPGWEHPYYWAAFQLNGLSRPSSRVETVEAPTDLSLRVEAVSREGTRGGQPMSTDRIVVSAEMLLAQMEEDPAEVLAALDPAERAAVVGALGALSEQAANVQNDADLLSLADAIHRLVEDTPGLRALLLEERTDVVSFQSDRAVTLADHEGAARTSQYAQTRAPQIRNAVIEVHQALVAALQSQVERRGPHGEH